MTPQLRDIAVEELRHLRRNPQFMSEAEMNALQESIRKDGFLAPILVRPIPKKGGGGFEILSGNHRVMAAREIGMKAVPAVVAKINDADAQRIAVNLNTVHGDPTPELLAPFLAEMDDEVLASVHLDKGLTRELKAFDADLAAQLAAAEIPASLDQQGVGSGATPSCVCSTCGRRHVPKD